MAQGAGDLGGEPAQRADDAGRSRQVGPLAAVPVAHRHGGAARDVGGSDGGQVEVVPEGGGRAGGVRRIGDLEDLRPDGRGVRTLVVDRGREAHQRRRARRRCRPVLRDVLRHRRRDAERTTRQVVSGAHDVTDLAVGARDLRARGVRRRRVGGPSTRSAVTANGTVASVRAGIVPVKVTVKPATRCPAAGPGSESSRRGPRTLAEAVGVDVLDRGGGRSLGPLQVTGEPGEEKALVHQVAARVGIGDHELFDRDGSVRRAEERHRGLPGGEGCAPNVFWSARRSGAHGGWAPSPWPGPPG